MESIAYKVVIQKNEEGDGYWAYSPDLPGCSSIGETLAEVKSNIREAILGYLETLAAMNQAIPAPQDDSVYLETVGVSF